MTTESSVIGRFAPSPTGRMHLGNVYAALLSWLSCKSQGGRWLLRIEDIDPQRSKPQFTELLKEDLQWLGLEWDMYAVQSERYDRYERALAQLPTYDYYKTRNERLVSGAPHVGERLEREVSGFKFQDSGFKFQDSGFKFQDSGAHIGDSPYCAIPSQAQGATLGTVPGCAATSHLSPTTSKPPATAIRIGDEDVILRRSDGAWAYQLAVVVDDAELGVTEVVRGRDLLDSVRYHHFLQDALGYPHPEYRHLPLLVNDAGQRLCKRDKALDMGELRKQYTPEQIIGRLAYLAGQQPTPDPLSAQSLLSVFNWDNLPADDIYAYRNL